MSVIRAAFPPRHESAIATRHSAAYRQTGGPSAKPSHRQVKYSGKDPPVKMLILLSFGLPCLHFAVTELACRQQPSPAPAFYLHTMQSGTPTVANVDLKRTSPRIAPNGRHRLFDEGISRSAYCRLLLLANFSNESCSESCWNCEPKFQLIILEGALCDFQLRVRIRVVDCLLRGPALILAVVKA